MYETKPWGELHQDNFINIVVLAETSLSPVELLKRIKCIEQDMGRKETYRWGPRIIDIDILFYDSIILKTEDLIIPHPLLHKRDFVLQPFMELSPEFIHPLLKKSIRNLYSDFLTITMSLT